MQAPDLFANFAKRTPNALCVVEGDRRLTFGEADERAARAAAAFAVAGLQPGDRVALLAENDLEYLELIAATMRAGTILVPLNYRMARPELDYIISDSQPRLLIYGSGYATLAAQLPVEQRWQLGTDGSGDGYERALARANPPSERPVIDAAATSTILYSSGTTGRPKGAVISSGALLARCTMMALEAGIRPGDSFLQCLPMFHIAANVSCAFSYLGAANIQFKGFDPKRVINLLETTHATHTLIVPTMISALCEEPSLKQADLSGLRMVIYGASPIAPDLLRRAITLLGADFLQLFGMTETHGSSMLRPADHDPDRYPHRLASAGTDALSFDTRVVDAQDRDLPVGEKGEILSRGPCVMDGYWNNPSATAEALRHGWMHTGDVGYKDSDGFLYVTDRLKDMIITGGENVYPREVEDVLVEHPSVQSAAVIGVPDQHWGESVVAVIVPRGRPPAEADLIDHCRQRLAGYKIPRTFEFVESLPMGATGKVLKRELRERYAARPKEVVQPG